MGHLHKILVPGTVKGGSNWLSIPHSFYKRSPEGLRDIMLGIDIVVSETGTVAAFVIPLGIQIL